MTFVVTQDCVDVKDKSCIEVCPVDCLYEGGRMMYIRPDQCINCGACEAACPMEAIRFEGELEGDEEKFLGINAQFFETQDVPKGGRKLGRIDHDEPFIAHLEHK
ncbi:ferredoxin [Arthrobacter sunyaminii]|uniref:Ferredoxin n=1 Tax=Arthrobacter sunyaminii TaxID=2816859 RepID=A0A975S6A5_9MICC|nr:ferredoxin [Arthrobacter sunyaminii]MBO0909823.1 ferredoxin family protein [Arthrobacter sunyaminii]QWQ36613.1 ferredoxin family protein [Arthrobacter sunyaminii]